MFFNKAAAWMEADVSTGSFNAGLLSGGQVVSGSSCNRPNRSKFSVVYLGSRANTELVLEFNVALYASHAALPMVTFKISP
jgi:hypothetical protein